ncbi:hypothetical protein GR140_19155 [Pseudomonas putida]|uniref:hypothetical protein n=1 Tax=Pseudomonas putida TaxID=303 RepID=UPI001BAEAFAC|nr:hypothetical protein [Pseudomonas putida]QUG90785.1 hypothetical protein GR140_19155 [Pseudomonas putida]
MSKKEIQQALNGSKKPFNSVHYQYPVNDKASKSQAITEEELKAALQNFNALT